MIKILKIFFVFFGALICLSVMGQIGTPLPPLSDIVEVKPNESKSDENKTLKEEKVVDAAPQVTLKKNVKIPNSIAVAEFYIRNDYKDFFYDEKLNSNFKLDGNANTNPNVNSVAVLNGTEADQKPPAQSSTATVNIQSDVSYSKNYGTRTIISYKEIRGLTAQIKSMLIKAGYQVIQPAPYVHNGAQDIDVNNLKGRSDRGDFYDAAFVLQGTVINADSRRTREFIQGTTDYSYKQENSIIVEFNLIDTETFQVASSFTVSGFGRDMYLGKVNSTFTPRTDKIARELLSSFNQDALKKIQEEIPNLNKDAGVSKNTIEKDATSIGDVSTLKVYGKPKQVDGQENDDKKNPMTVYKK